MMNRRRFLQLAGTAGMGLLAFPTMSFPQIGAAAGRETPPDLELALRAGLQRARIFSGPQTDVWAYTGRILNGDPAQLTPLSDSYLGPLIRVKKGQRIRIHFENGLPAQSIIHWHGLHVPADMDGHPRLAVPPGGSYTYDFEVHNRAGTYWYHPHPHGRTGHQVYGGLAGLFIVTDDEEAGLELPTGKYDLPLVIQDRSFDRHGQLVYLTGGHMQQMQGFLGDTLLVNGKAQSIFGVDAQVYRLRILNGSNSRIYNLAWDPGMPLTVLATDGGLLQEPATISSCLLAPGERLELWADFSSLQPGETRRLISRAFDAGSMHGMHHRGMMGRRGMHGGTAPPNGAPFEIAGFRLDRRADGPRLRLPKRLSEPGYPDLDRADNFARPRRFRLDMGPRGGTINGRVFHMTDVAEDEIVRAGSLEIWEFFNGGHRMAMPHPMHVHGLHFRVLERQGGRWNAHLDRGWKDTVLVMPGEWVRLLVRFETYPGLFLYHCHNLEHEDMGMMRNLYVLPAGDNA